MELLIEQFHFLRPMWFVALIPAVVLAILLHRYKNQAGQWYQYLPAHLSSVLIDQGDMRKKSRTAVLLLTGWVVAIFALAGPTWQKIEQPLFKMKQAHIVIVDMSLSMYSTDIAPNRLTRAKYKLTDLLKQLGEGETGLIAFAGDAFVISPMTADVANLLNLIPSLNPSIMPAFGSRPDLAVEKALELLKQSQYQSGQIYLFADDLEPSQAREITTLLKNTNVQLNIMAIGTTKGAPIKLPNDQLLKDQGGNIVIPQLPTATMANLSNSLGGKFVKISHDLSDINTLIPHVSNDGQTTEVDNQFGDRWHEAGPYLLLLLLPLLAFSLRKGMHIAILLCIVSLASVSPQSLHAQTNAASADVTTPVKTSSWWNDLWRTGDQQGHQAYLNGDHQQALTRFNDPKWRGASQYQSGQYQEALTSFEQHDDSDALFNQGNALVQLGQYQEAINRYQKALEQATDTTAIKKNIDIAEQLLEQQKEQQKKQGNDDSSQSKDQEQQNSDSQQDQSQEQDQQGEQQDQQQQENQAANNKSDQSKPGESDEQQQQDAQQAQQGKDGEENQQQDKPLTEEQKKQQQEQQQKADKLNETFNKENLSKEQLAHLNQLVKKINDDPSLLLKNKMAVEARQRQRQRTSHKENKNW